MPDSHDVLNTDSMFMVDLFLKDVAIAYGFNEIPRRKLPSLKPLSLNQFSDLIRMEVIFSNSMPMSQTTKNCSFMEFFRMFSVDDFILTC